MSNKTRKATVKKTKLVRDIAITAFVVALFLSFLATIQLKDRVVAPSNQSDKSCPGLSLRETCYPLERAETRTAQIRGLSNRDSLPPKTGMLFVFEQPMEQCIWMKDMMFDIDIIWLDDTKKISKIMRYVSPSTYPNSFCGQATKYVVELNSGEADKLELSIGQTLAF